MAHGEGSDRGEPGAAQAEAAPPSAAQDSGVPAALVSPPPEPSPLERQVALARLKGRLFAREQPVTLGRYHLLEMVGKGGMGVVWGAWDPQLERRVALKVMQPTLSATRERMLVEGQALARLSHPNVVPIYDVGLIDDRVYLVMEWVRGESLRAYAEAPRSLRELVAVYRQAGEGLAAAHRAGLIHRDFKPDNAIRGEDGRVRVLDFGLARGELAPAAEGTEAGAIASSPGLTAGAGTPRYMAPEQVTGAALTAAADQYAFCVALREALARRAGGAALPRHLAAVIERGAQAEPTRRFPSMRALLEALDRDPARRRRRRALVASAVAAAALAFALGRSGARRPPDPCTGGATELAAVWSGPLRAQLVARLAALGDYGREQAPGVTEDLQRAAEAWAGAYQQACAAHQRAELTAELYQRRLGCLARTKVALGTAAEVLRGVRRDGLDNALLAARSLPDASLCAQGDATELAPPPAAVAAQLPLVIAAIERARILAVAVHPGALAVAQQAAQQAARLGYGPVTARAQLVLGQVEASLSRWDGAEQALHQALQGAVRSGDDVVAVEAFARLLWAASRRGRAVDGASIIEPLALRTGPAGAFGRALLYNNLGTRQLASADREGARRYLEAAAAELAAPRGPVDIELLSVAQNMVLVAKEAPERERRASAVVAVAERALGANHARTLAVRVFEANETANLALAQARFADTCARYQRYHPHLATVIANCFYRLGALADEAGDETAAVRAMALAVADPGSERLQAQVAELSLAMRAAAARGPATARAVLEQLQGFVDVHATDKEFWKRLTAVDAAIIAATALRALGDGGAAQRMWQRALALAEPLDPPLVQRRLARIRAQLALALADREPARARELAAAALVWYGMAGGQDEITRELTALRR